jgi:hypothetical protein
MVFDFGMHCIVGVGRTFITERWSIRIRTATRNDNEICTLAILSTNFSIGSHINLTCRIVVEEVSLQIY